ncbi:MAG: hypothetical protein WC702_03725 [Patescibacteria group bacterium]|jgi:hypothetical protein
MLRLNIPLSTNQSTRPNLKKGRVLWILFGFFILVLVPFTLANLWVSRDTVSSFAPEGTLAIIHLTPSRQAWTKLINDFGGLTLISDRSITIRDLAGLKTKEISIFYLQNNASAVAIRTRERNLQREILNSYGISVQKLGRNRWLLSNRPLPYSVDSKTTWSLSSIWPRTLGTVRLDGFLGQITANKRGYSLDTPKIKKVTSLLPNLPEAVTAAVSFQPNSKTDLSAIFLRFDTLLDPLGTIKSEEIAQKMEENGGMVLLTNSDFLIETTLESSFLSQILQTAAVFRSPIVKTMPMPDGSFVQEMFIDQTGAEFSSIWINGSEVKSTKTENGSFFALDGEKTDIISSDQALLEDYLNKKQEKTNAVCGQKKLFAYLKPNELEKGVFGNTQYVVLPNLLNFGAKFEEIVLTSRKVFLCY